MGFNTSQQAYAQGPGTAPTGGVWIDVRDPTSLQGETLTVTVFGITTNIAVCFISDNVLGPARVQCVPLASKTMPPAVRDFITASGFTGDNPIDMRN